MSVGMYEQHFDKVTRFCNIYDELINCHVVDFVTDDLWNTCVPAELRSELESSNLDFFHWTSIDNYPALNNFIKLTKALSLESCSMDVDSKDLTGILPNSNHYAKHVRKSVKVEFMNAKKMHEVESLGSIIGRIAAETNSLVIDAGAGKAYLSMSLAENHKVPVLAIDSSELRSRGAICKKKKLQNRTEHSANLVQYVIEEINDKTDYIRILKQTFHDWNINKNLILTGLHTCGSLTHSVIRTFLTTEDINVLCIVPCCYHLTNETFNKHTIFSKNARMLAQQSVERSMRNNNCVESSLFYRAVLQVVLHSLGIYDARVGRGGPLEDFASYAQWAFKKIGIESNKTPPREKLLYTFRMYAHLSKRFSIFQMLRVHVAPVLEAAIMLDRIIFLEKSNQCSKLSILRLFDPALSPRRYGIIALR